MEEEKSYNGFWKYMSDYIRPYYKKLTVTMLAAIVVGVCVALQPLVIKWIVDDGISNTALNNTDKIKFVGAMCLFYILLGLSRVSLWRIALINMLKSQEGALFNLRSAFFSHVQNMCMRFHDNTSVGELFNCILGSPIVNIKTYMTSIFLSVPYQAVSFVISITALSCYDITLTFILLATALVMAIFNIVSRKRIKNLFKDYIKAETEASHYLNDTLHGMDAIKLYSIEDNFLKVFKEYISNMYEKGVKASYSQSSENLKPEMVQYIGTSVVYLVGAIFCIYRGLSVGVLYAFLSSMGTDSLHSHKLAYIRSYSGKCRSRIAQDSANSQYAYFYTGN